MVKEVEAINKMRKNVSIQLKHSLRDDHTVGDFFANLAVDFVGTYLSTTVKKILNIDSMRMPHFRFA